MPVLFTVFEKLLITAKDLIKLQITQNPLNNKTILNSQYDFLCKLCTYYLWEI
jgi:tetraacyldisaccharide-1-P 4'-kinase